jgi:hypothetical protein
MLVEKADVGGERAGEREQNAEEWSHQLVAERGETLRRLTVLLGIAVACLEPATQTYTKV